VERQEAVAGPIGEPRDATSSSTIDQHRVVSIRVLRTYRGEAPGTVSVSTGGEGDCGFDVETGSQYLVYADKDDNKNPAPAPASAVGLPSSAHRLGASRAAP
jgi:hypothetical protein